MVINKEFSASGLVFGQTWAGYNATLKTKGTLYGETKKELLTKAKKGIMNGSLGSGDFQFLKGALLNIVTKSTIVYEGIEFYRTDTEQQFLGDLTDEEKDFLLECYYNQI